MAKAEKPALDTVAARALLEERLALVEQARQGGTRTVAPSGLHPAIAAVTDAKTQSIREALLGALVAKALAPAIDMTRPYVDQGEGAFSGRTLDERAVNPFLREHRFPCSTGPFLNMFRRQARFDASYVDKVRDKSTFEAMLAVIEATQADPALVVPSLDALLEGFSRLRDAASVDLLTLPLIALDQCRRLIGLLLPQPSGGRWPMLLTVAALLAFAHRHGLPWLVEFQGINVADKASGAGGDITVRSGKAIVMAFEVTERPLDAARIRTTHTTKIAALGIEDYVFLHGQEAPSAEAREIARRLFAQGHDLLLAPCSEFVMSLLTLAGRAGRSRFIVEARDLLAGNDVPTALKLAWNEAVSELTAG